MKTKLALLLSLFLFSSGISLAQKFTFGIENGINFSNIRKEFDYQRFESQQGPVNGIFAKYELGNWFVLQSGLSHLTMYYSENQNYSYRDYNIYTSSSYYPSSSMSCIAPSYSYQSSNKYSFLRIPLLIKFRTPGRVNFEIGGGYYYSFLTNDEYRGKDKDRFDKEYRDANFPDMTDWGWILASSINYNINNKWNVFASGQITYGKEEYFENIEGKMGTTELSFGIGYKPFTKQNQFTRNDTLGNRISILPHTGINVSRVKSDKNDGEYGSSLGLSTGVSLKLSIGNNVSFISGAWYDRKGYNLDYKGTSAVVFQPTDEEIQSHVKSDVHLDYLTIPFLMDISFGEKIQSSIDFGAYLSLLQNAFTEGERINTQQYQQGYRVNKQYFDESLDLWFKNTDAGFMFAYQLDVPVFKWASAFASVNYSIGISNILNDSSDAKDQYSFIGEQELRNRSAAILLGLTIPVNKN